MAFQTREVGERIRFFLFFLILFAGFFLGWEFFLESSTEQAREEFIDSALAETQTLAVENEPELFIRQRILPMLAYHPDSARISLERVGRFFRSRLGIPVSFFRFNPQGELVEIVPRDAPQVWLMKNLYKGLQMSSGSSIEEIQRQLAKKIPYVFGDDKDLETIKNARGKILEIFAGGQEGFLAWNSTRFGGMMAYCPKVPDDITIFQCQEGRIRGGKGFSGKRLCSGFGYQGGNSFVSTRTTSDVAVGKVFTDLRNKGLTEGEVDDSWWVFQETHSGRNWFAEFPKFAPPLGPLKKVIRAAGICVCLGMAWALLLSPLISRFSLKEILLGLFLASSVVPLVGVIIGSINLVQLNQSRIGLQTGMMQNTVLRDLASGFDAFRPQSARKIAKILENPGSGRDARRNAAMEKGLKRLGFLSSFYVRDPAGNLLHSNVPTYSLDRETLNRSVAREAIERHCPSRRDEVPYKGDILTDKLVKANDMGIVEVLEAPKALSNITLGNNPLLFYFQVYPNNIGGAAVAEIRQPLFDAVANYLLRKSRDRVTTRGSMVALYALHMETLHWTVAPPPFLRNRLKSLALRSLISNQAQSMRFGGGYHSGFAHSLHYPKLAEHCLIAVNSDAELVREVDSRWRWSMVGAACLIGVLFLLAHNVSSILLAPLSHLEAGANALKRKNFLFKLPDGDNDEMDQLFRAFNEMMADTQDLEVARLVQEKLIPAKLPQIEGYSVFGRLFMASHLGGDCLDFLRLPDGRVLFLVGDISGHGMASALLMAFTRAITFHWSRQDHVTVAGLADDLDATLRRRTGAKEFLGVIVGILDPISHRIEFTVQGHIYPWLQNPDGTGEWIGQPSLPLGRGKPGRTFTTMSCDLKPGSVFFWVTDGFVESRAQDGEVIGFDLVASWLKETRNPNPEAWVGAMMTRRSEWTGDQQDDDITVLLIERQGG